MIFPCLVKRTISGLCCTRNPQRITQSSVTNLWYHCLTLLLHGAATRASLLLSSTYQELKILQVKYANYYILLSIFIILFLNWLADTTYFVPVNQKNSLQAKASYAPVVYVQSSCNAPSERDTLVEELSKYIAIDSYGQCLNNKSLPEQLGRKIHYSS